MTQGAYPPPPPPHHGPPMGDYDTVSPTGMAFNDSFAGGRRNTQADFSDLSQRFSNVGFGNDEGTFVKKGSLLRKRSESRKSSMRRPSESFSRSASVASPDYELYRLDKIGDDWTEADRYIISTPQKELAAAAKKGKSRTGTVFEQMQKMVHTRRSQIDDLTEKKFHETGMRWEPVFIEEGKATMIGGKRSIKTMDVIVARLRGSTSAPPVRPSLSYGRAKSTSYKGEHVVVQDRNNSRDQYDIRSSSKSQDDFNRYSKHGKGGNKLEIMDPDPFGATKLFAPSGKTLPSEGIPTDIHIVNLPPHIPLDEPIGKRPKHRGQSRDEHDGDKHDDIVDGPLDGKGGGAVEVLDGVNLDDILPKGKKGKKSVRSRSQSKSQQARSNSRSQSRPRSRARAHAEHRSNRSRRVDSYMDDYSDRSSDSSDRSMFLMDDNSSITSESIHRNAKGRGSLHRRDSSRASQPFREHYRGPERANPRYSGEQIIIPERRVSYVRPQKQITYPEPYGSMAVGYPRSLSPRRSYGPPPELYFPHEVRDTPDRNMEARVNGYMQNDRLKEYELSRREQDVDRREKILRRQSGGYHDPYRYT